MRSRYLFRTSGIVVGKCTLCALVVLLCAALTQTAQGQFTFQRIVDLPVDELTSPVLSNGQIAWNELRGNDIIRFWDGNTTTTVLSSSSVIPGSTEQFSSVYIPHLSNGTITFRGQGGNPQQRGIYQFDGNTISTVADLTTAVPGSSTTLQSFRRHAVDGNDVAFIATDQAGTTGVYKISEGTLSLLADTNTQRPGGTDLFNGFSGLAIDNGAVVFTDGNPNNTTQVGISSHSDGVLRSLVTADTIISDSGEAFGDPRFLLGLDNGTAVVNQEGGRGLFSIPVAGGALETIASQTSLVPGENGRMFSSLSGAAIDGDAVVFIGRLPEGIYARINGELVTIIQRGDLLDGQIAQGFNLSPDGIEGDQVAFTVRAGPGIFDITRNSIYLLDLNLQSLLGDCNKDGVVNFLDINPFINFLFFGYETQADINEDGIVDFFDIAPFITLLSS